MEKLRINVSRNTQQLILEISNKDRMFIQTLFQNTRFPRNIVADYDDEIPSSHPNISMACMLTTLSIEELKKIGIKTIEYYYLLTGETNEFCICSDN